jgi:hypothetical protein
MASTGGNLDETSAWDLIDLGTAVRFLRDCQPGWAPLSPGGVVENFDLMARETARIRLPVVSRAIGATMSPLFERLRLEPDGYTLSEEDAATIQKAMDRLMTVLAAEATGQVIYATAERRHDVAKLMRGVDQLFGAGVYASLTDIAAYDFQEAGRCLAFGVPTAAAFHLLRGTEEVLRVYYRSWITRNRMRVLLWYPMVAALLALRRGPDRTALSHLDYMRQAFRNPTDHPEKIYDMDAAEDLLGLCIEAVNRMTKSMRPKPKPKPTATGS